MATTHTTQPFVHAGGVFAALHKKLLATTIDWAQLDASQVPPPLLPLVCETWAFRAQTELESVEVMTRFLRDVLEAGDPIEIYSAAAEAIRDEVRHTALCVGVVEALGQRALLPERRASEPAEFLSLPAAGRALGTAISMLAINETVSVALLRDLAARATHPVIKDVLLATFADEDEHGGFGWHYLAASIERFDGHGRDYARTVARETLSGFASSVAEAPSPDSEHDELELARWGLLSAGREARVIARAIDDEVAPALRRLGLL